MRRAVGCTLLILGLAGCTAGDASRGGPAGTVVIVELGEPGLLLPVLETNALENAINEQLYLGLNSGRWEDGELVYVIDELSAAERWTFSADSTSVTYALRPDVVWSDGTPLTAEDAVFTYEMIRDTLVASPYSYLWANLDSVVASDPRSVTFFFQRRNPEMLFVSGGVNLIPAHVFQDADRATLRSHPRVVDPANGKLVVSGPYTVGSWAKGSQLTLVPNPRAVTARPAIERIIFRVIPEESTRLVELENGTVDVTWPIPFERAPAIAAHPRLRLERVTSRYFEFAAWNETKVTAFADPVVRLALSLAIDRRALLDALDMDEFARPAGGPYPPIFRAYRDPAVSPDPYAPDSARALLRLRGWRDTDGDGILEKGGRPFRFTLTTNSGNARRESVIQMLQAQLRRVGVDVQLRVMESNAFWDAVWKLELDAVVAGWQVALNPDLSPFFYPGQLFNITGYDNPRTTALIDSALAQPTTETAARFWRAVARQVAADRPYAFLYDYDGVVGVNERVRNTRIDTYGVYQNLHAWRLEEAVAARF